MPELDLDILKRCGVDPVWVEELELRPEQCELASTRLLNLRLDNEKLVIEARWQLKALASSELPSNFPLEPGITIFALFCDNYLEILNRISNGLGALNQLNLEIFNQFSNEDVKKLVSDPEMLKWTSILEWKTPGSGYQLAHYAAALGKVSILKWIKEEGFYYLLKQETTKDKNSIAHLAARSGQIKVLDWILEQEPVLLTGENNKKQNIAYLPFEPHQIEVFAWIKKHRPLLLRLPDIHGCNIAYRAFEKRQYSALNWIKENEPDLLERVHIKESSSDRFQFSFIIELSDIAMSDTDFKPFQWLKDNVPDLVSDTQTICNKALKKYMPGFFNFVLENSNHPHHFIVNENIFNASQPLYNGWEMLDKALDTNFYLGRITFVGDADISKHPAYNYIESIQVKCRRNRILHKNIHAFKDGFLQGISQKYIYLEGVNEKEPLIRAENPIFSLPRDLLMEIFLLLFPENFLEDKARAIFAKEMFAKIYEARTPEAHQLTLDKLHEDTVAEFAELEHERKMLVEKQWGEEKAKFKLVESEKDIQEFMNESNTKDEEWCHVRKARRTILSIIDDEIKRLQSDIPLSIKLGLVKSSESKVAAFKKLQSLICGKKVINHSEIIGFKEAIKQWSKDNTPLIQEKRNRLHTFFNKDHQTTSKKTVESIKNILKI